MTRLFEDPPAAISHPAHPEHDLNLVTTSTGAGAGPFRCDGCMQPGEGPSWYRCEPCNYDLHTCCALPSPTLEHAMFKGRTFVFHHEHPSPACGRFCDACGDDVVAGGFAYHCRDRDLDLHPCCALLEPSFVHDGRAFELRMDASGRCGMCSRADGRRRRKFWSYVVYEDGKAVYLHVACLKDAHARRGRSIGGGRQILVEANNSPITEGVLQSLPRSTRRSGGFDKFRRIVGVVVSVIIAVIFGNPLALVSAVAGPGGLLRG